MTVGGSEGLYGYLLGNEPCLFDGFDSGKGSRKKNHSENRSLNLLPKTQNRRTNHREVKQEKKHPPKTKEKTRPPKEKNSHQSIRPK